MRAYRRMLIVLGRFRWFSWLTYTLFVPLDRALYKRSGGRLSLHTSVSDASTIRRGRPATEDEKQALWPQLLKLYPTWEAYTHRTDRSFRAFFLESPQG